MKSIFLFLLLIVLVTSSVLSADEKRQFDFWVGEWDVNLRQKQKDNSWKDSVKAKAKIYPILDGEAILELWDGGKDGIIGYSLRNYNQEKKRWDLWLNWPAKNRSGTSRLAGTFRHGRGEFFVKNVVGRRERITRYTFSDISENSLRWDDAFSNDKGATWSSNWIMEFSRTSQKPRPIGDEKNLPTYFSGERCDSEEFALTRESCKRAQKHTREKGLQNSRWLHVYWF